MRNSDMATVTKGWLSLEVPERRTLEQSPLQLVLCQVKFPLLFGAQLESSVEKFYGSLKSEYPVAFPPEQLVAEVQVTVGNAVTAPPSIPTKVWKFADLHNNWTAVLTPDFVALETRAYTGFEDFTKRLDAILSALAVTVSPPVTTRIGLRYINELRPGHSNWTTVIRSEILGVMSVPELAMNASQAIQQVSLRDKVGLRVNFRHGAFADGTTVEPRTGIQPSSGPFYLLDIDSFQEFSSSSWVPFETHSISTTVGQLHNAASTIFRWSLLDAYISSL